VMPDADVAGAEHADMVTANLLPVAKSVRRIELPGLAEKQDVCDWLAGGGTAAKLAELARASPLVQVAPLGVQPEPPDVFETYDLQFLRTMPPVEFVVDGLLTRHGLAVIYGEPGAGKSFLAIDLALSIAYGTSWHGNGVERGAVLYIAGEGVGGMGKRVKAWQSHYGVQEDAPFYVLPTAVRFRDEEDIERLLRTIDNLGVRFSAVFVDTVARSLLGGDENSATDMGMFVDACEVVKRHTQCALVAIHHSGKDVARGMRGSTALLGAVDTSVRVSKRDELMSVSVEKQKDAEPIPEQNFEMVSVALLEDTGVVIRPVDAEPAQRRVKLTTDQHLALQSLRVACLDMARDWVPVTRWHEAHRDKTPDVTSGKRRDARAALQNKGVIVIEKGKVWENKGLGADV